MADVGFDITDYAQQIESEALQHLTFVADEAEKRIAPILQEPFPKNDKYRNILDAYFRDPTFTYTVNPNVQFIDATSITETNTPSKPDLEVTTVIQLENTSNLTDLLDSVIIDKPDTSTDRIEPKFTAILATDFPTIPTVPSLAINKPETILREVYESSYLQELSLYVEGILQGVGTDNFKNILNSQIEKYVYDLKFLIDQEFKNTAKLRFRKPNSQTLYNTRQHYEKFFERLLQLSEKFVNELSSFILNTHKLGISKEQLVVDFTEHINTLNAALIDFEVEIYKTKLNYLINRYNQLSEKAALKVEIELTKTQKEIFDLKVNELGLKVKSAQLQSKETYLDDLLKFGALYTDNNEVAIKEKLTKLDKRIFERSSEILKEQTDLTTAARASVLKSKLAEADIKVVEQKVDILNQDLDSFDKLGELHNLEFEKIKTEYEAILRDIKLKIAALNELDTIARASAEVIKAVSNSQIELTTIKG